MDTSYKSQIKDPSRKKLGVNPAQMMELPSRRTVFISTCIFVVFVTLLAINSSFRNESVNLKFASMQAQRRKHFLVDSAVCKIPDIDPFDASIRKLISKGKPLYCGDIDGLTYQIGDKVFVNRTVVTKLYAKVFSHCESDTVIRVENGKTDNKYKFVPNQGKFNVSYDLKNEFTRLRCYNTSKTVIHYNFYAIHTPKLDVEKRYAKSFPRHVKEHSVKHTYNVLLMGIDSVSRLNFIRHLHKTRDILLNELGAIDIAGYNKVADNTFVNLTPFLAGKYVPELPYDIAQDKGHSFDKYDFIFKRYRSAGYRTLYCEDDPYIATYNYIKEGFYKQPADYYMRPMSVAMENEKTLRAKNEHCVHERGEHDIYTDYIYRFIKANVESKRPFFSFTFLTRITHYWMNKAALADDHHYKFLRRLKDGKLLNNTVMIYFSDHGMRYGSIRGTFVGKLSARLPAMYVYLPPSFKRDHPSLYQNVVTNSHRLTTPFDIYETLQDLLYFNESVGHPADIRNRGLSLFSEIPMERSCINADIEPHWCACASEQPISVNESVIVKSAELLIHHLNDMIKPNADICETLKFSRTTHAYKINPNLKMLMHNEKVSDVEKFQKKISLSIHYVITVVTSPGEGRFEATVTHLLAEDKMVISGDVSRTNLYGNSSWCIQNAGLKKICYCKVQKSRPN